MTQISTTLLVLVVLVIQTLAQATKSPEGSWQGTLDAGKKLRPDGMRIQVRLERVFVNHGYPLFYAIPFYLRQECYSTTFLLRPISAIDNR